MVSIIVMLVFDNISCRFEATLPVDPSNGKELMLQDAPHWYLQTQIMLHKVARTALPIDVKVRINHKFPTSVMSQAAAAAAADDDLYHIS